MDKMKNAFYRLPLLVRIYLFLCLAGLVLHLVFNDPFLRIVFFLPSYLPWGFALNGFFKGSLDASRIQFGTPEYSFFFILGLFLSGLASVLANSLILYFFSKFIRSGGEKEGR